MPKRNVLHETEAPISTRHNNRPKVRRGGERRS